MKKYPNRHRNHQIETLSERFLKNSLPISWVVNSYHLDYGTDYNCEIANENHITGNNFSIQLKGKETEQNLENIKISLKRTNINRWLNRLEPTIIIVYIVDENEAYWKWIEDNTVDLTQNYTTYTVAIPRENKLSNLNWDRIADYVKNIFSKRYLLYDAPKINKINENGWKAFYSNKFEESLSEFYKVIKTDANNAPILEAISIAEYNLFNYRKALINITKAIEIDDNNHYKFIKASILTEEGFVNNDYSKIEEAIKIYTYLLNNGFISSEVYYNYGSALIRLEQYEVSIGLFKKALILNPNSPEAWNNLGNCYMNLGQHNLEMICYNNALKINPHLAETLFSKGSSLFRYFGKINEGLTLMIKSTELTDRHEVDNPNVFFWIAEAYLASKDFEKTKEWNYKGLLYFPNNEHLKMQSIKILKEENIG